MSSSSSDLPSLQEIESCLTSMQKKQSLREFRQSLPVIKALSSWFNNDSKTLHGLEMTDEPRQISERARTVLDVMWLSYLRIKIPEADFMVGISDADADHTYEQMTECLRTVNDVRENALARLDMELTQLSKLKAKNEEKMRVYKQWLEAEKSRKATSLFTHEAHRQFMTRASTKWEDWNDQLVRLSGEERDEQYLNRFSHRQKAFDYMSKVGSSVSQQGLTDTGSLAQELATRDYLSLAKCPTSVFPDVYKATLELLEATQSGESNLGSSAQTAANLRTSTTTESATGPSGRGTHYLKNKNRRARDKENKGNKGNEGNKGNKGNKAAENAGRSKTNTVVGDDVHPPSAGPLPDVPNSNTSTASGVLRLLGGVEGSSATEESEKVPSAESTAVGGDNWPETLNDVTNPITTSPTVQSDDDQNQSVARSVARSAAGSDEDETGGATGIKGPLPDTEWTASADVTRPTSPALAPGATDETGSITNPPVSASSHGIDAAKSVHVEESEPSQGPTDSTDAAGSVPISSKDSAADAASLDSGSSSDFLGVNWPEVRANDTYGNYSLDSYGTVQRRYHLLSSRWSGVRTRPPSPVDEVIPRVTSAPSLLPEPV